MNCVIMACGSLVEYVRAAQKKFGTSYPEIYLDKVLHAEPSLMRQSIIEKITLLPPEYDTILVAMGYCGGSWKDINSDRRIVRPAVDDCVSLLLHTDKVIGYNLKKKGHLYLKDMNVDNFDLEKAFQGYTKAMKAEEKNKTEKLWKSGYSIIDIVDTGLNNCDTPEYRRCAERNAKWIDGSVERVMGSNMLIEKLISGEWDEGLFVIE